MWNFYPANFFPFGCRQKSILPSLREDTRSVWKYSESLFHVLKLYNLPPFLQLYFLLRLKMSEIGWNSCIMIRKAFCGNGIIHLNIAEFHEGNIGGQKKRAYSANQGSKWTISSLAGKKVINFLKAMQLYKRMDRPLTIRSTSVSLSCTVWREWLSRLSVVGE